MNARASSALRSLAWIACAFAFCVIVFGAFVRLSNAGLSCPDWPTCYGHVTWPQHSGAIAQADAAFPDRPYETHKAWREQMHRFLAGTLGLLVLALALAATWRERRRMFAVIAGVVLIAVGIPLYMQQNHVPSALCAAAGEVSLLACALVWRDGGWRRISGAGAGGGLVPGPARHVDGDVAAETDRGLGASARRHWRPSRCWRGSRGDFAGAGARNERERALAAAVTIGLILLACQIALGGWTSSNYAALACGTDFPKCLGAVVAADGFPPGLHPVARHRRGLRRRHPRRGRAQRDPDRASLRRAGGVLSISHGCRTKSRARACADSASRSARCCCAQVALGISNVVFGLPLPVAAAHNGVRRTAAVRDAGRCWRARSERLQT